MVYNYKNCIDMYGTDYKLKMALNNNEIFKLDNGVYYDEKYISDFELLTLKRPDGIFTMNTAFFIYGLTDELPSAYDMAIDRLSSKTKFKKCIIKYYYQPQNILCIGKTQHNYNGISINIYDKERLLIELFRYSTKMSFDIYKVVINNYRKIEIDFEKIEEYAKHFRNEDKLIEKFRLEVL